MTEAVLIAVAVALWLAAPATTARLGESTAANQGRSNLQHPTTASTWPRRGLQCLLVASALLFVGVLAGVVVAGWTAVAGIVIGTAAWVLSSARRDTRIRKRRDEVARETMGLAMLLRAGQIPFLALMEAARDSAELAPVAASARLGGDVAAAFREAAQTPGREGLARVAAAWQVAERSGAPIATVLLQVAEGLRREREVAGMVEAELAMARGSARIMAVLPLGALLLGALVGADPVGFLVSHPLGLVLALIGVSLGAVGVYWTERLSRP